MHMKVTVVVSVKNRLVKIHVKVAVVVNFEKKNCLVNMHLKVADVVNVEKIAWLTCTWKSQS